MRRKILSVLLSAALALSLFGALPVTAWADTPEPSLESPGIFANGTALILTDGTTEGNTVIYIDADRDGEIDAGEEIWAPGEGSLTDDTEQGNDLSHVYIHGGGYQSPVSGDTKLTMLGGKVTELRGGGSGMTVGGNGDVDGNTWVTVSGGTVTGNVIGGGCRRYVTGNTHVTVSGTAEINGSVIGGDCATGGVNGTTTVIISAGTISGNVIGGNPSSGTVGSAAITVTGGTVAGSVLANGGSAVATAASLTVGGGAAIGGGGTSGIYLNGGSFTQGFAGFTIADDLTGADGAVGVVLPADFDASANPAIATGAVSGDLAKIRLAGESGYIPYFDTDSIKVKAMPTPTVDSDYHYICANGAPLLIMDGSAGTTSVYVDQNMNGAYDAGVDTAVTGAENADLSGYAVYGGSYQAAVSGDTKITMLGGTVGSIGGGGSGIGNSVTGHISVDIRGGTVSGDVTGDTVYENVALSSVSVNISGGTVGGSIKMTEGNTTILTRSLTVSGSAAIGAGNADGIRINVGGVTDGVDSFVIDGGLTGAEGSVHVLLPAFFGLMETATVATGAASGDLAKIRLAGVGADNKFACLDGSDVKAAPLPIINTTPHRIYAYGAPLLIAAGSGENTTTVYVDADGDGEKDSSEKSLSGWGVSNAPADNADLSDWFVYGAYSDAFTGNTRLTMTGGTVRTLCGGGDASVTGNTAVTIHGGTVASGVYGGVYGGINIGSVTGDTSVVMTGGDVNTLYSGGGCDIYGISVSGTASASVTGGTVRQNINKSVGGNVDGWRLTVGGGAVIGEDDSHGIMLTASVSDTAFFDFLIAPDLTQDASIHVWMPDGFGASSNRIIATGAVSGDLAAIELAGPGAAGKGIYLDGIFIRVGPACSVTLEGGGTGATGGGNHVSGAAVAINAGTRSGYIFNGWSSSAGVAFADAASASTTFTMPGNAVTVTASWRAAPSGGAPSGGTGNKTENVRIVSADGSTTATGAMTSSDNGLRVNIPSGQVDRLAGSGQSVRLETDTVTVGFDAAAMAHIDSAAGANDVVLEIALVDAETLPEADRDLVGGRPVYDFSLTAGSAAISDFGGGTASVGIPYTPAAGEDLNAIVVYYVSDAGVLETVRGRYNAVTGMVEFKTNHFSKYAVGYNKVSFSDVAAGSWSESAVTFIAARGIASGTGNGAFSPGAALTRGQFIVMLMRSYGIEADMNPTDNFTDAGDTYYTNYLAAAKRLGISNGRGGNRFEPGSEITRQDMFTLLYRALDVLGEYPEAAGTKVTSDFEDAGQISAYAEAAMNTLVGAGIISGSGGKLNPKGSTTRAEMAQVLYNLLRKS